MNEPTSITYRQFIDEVRRYNTADLITALAALDPKWSQVGSTYDQWRDLSPWGLAAIARESLLYGNVHRASRPIGEAEIRHLHLLFANTYERRDLEERDGPLEILTRHTHEQFPFQESDFEEITRSIAVLRFARAATTDTTLTDDQVDGLLGVPLELGVGAAVAIWLICQAHKGQWIDVLEEPQFMEAFEGVSPGAVREVRESLTIDQAGFKAAYESVPAPTSPHLTRWGYNPLSRYPLIRLPDGSIVAPQPRYILRRVSLGSLYYTGMEQHGTSFSRALGPVVERYVGQQLCLVSGGLLNPEITWGQPEKKSVDWFLVLPDCVVLIEVKSTRLTLGARSGDVDLVQKLQQALDKARGQVDKSAELVRQQHPAFMHIPNDRPLFGLIVTAEPVYIANSPWVDERLRAMDTPTRIKSLRYL